MVQFVVFCEGSKQYTTQNSNNGGSDFWLISFIQRKRNNFEERKNVSNCLLYIAPTKLEDLQNTERERVKCPYFFKSLLLVDSQFLGDSLSLMFRRFKAM